MSFILIALIIIWYQLLVMAGRLGLWHYDTPTLCSFSYVLSNMYICGNMSIVYSINLQLLHSIDPACIIHS